MILEMMWKLWPSHSFVNCDGMNPSDWAQLYFTSVGTQDVLRSVSLLIKCTQNNSQMYFVIYIYINDCLHKNTHKNSYIINKSTYLYNIYYYNIFPMHTQICFRLTKCNRNPQIYLCFVFVQNKLYLSKHTNMIFYHIFKSFELPISFWIYITCI